MIYRQQLVLGLHDSMHTHKSNCDCILCYCLSLCLIVSVCLTIEDNFCTKFKFYLLLHKTWTKAVLSIFTTFFCKEMKANIKYNIYY